MKLTLGTQKVLLFKKPIKIHLSEAKTHWHILGVTSSGKSRYLAHIFLSLLRLGLSATLIDPHGDLARLILSHLVANQYFKGQDPYQKMIYLDLPEGERRNLFIPFNVLKQNAPPHSIASNVKEAMHRAWPALAGGSAPMFDTLVQDGVKVLISNALPLTSLYRLLTDKSFRDSLLLGESDPDIISFFHDQYDRLSERDRVDQAGAALRRAHLLTFSPVLKYSLGQSDNILNFRDLFDSNKSLIVNLALSDYEARRLLGCLLTVLAEQGALSRADLPPDRRLGSHHLIVDEFSEFTAQSEEALTRILSQTRKYGLHMILAHQTYSQASDRLKGALQNVGIEVVFRVGRDDAEYTAPLLGEVDTKTVSKAIEEDRESVGMREQWEELVQELQLLFPRQAYIAIYHPHIHKWPIRLVLKPHARRVVKVKSPDVPNPKVDDALLKEVEEEYLSRYFVPQATVEEMLAARRKRDLPPRRE